MLLLFARRWRSVAAAVALTVGVVSCAPLAAGNNWAPSEHLPATSDGRLTDVDALSQTDAWAVGASQGTSGSSAPTPLPLAWEWDGVSWVNVSPPAPANGAVEQITLTAVGVASPRDVWVVGDAMTVPSSYVGTGNPENAATTSTHPLTSPVADHWGSTGWAVTQLPLPSFASGAVLTGVVATSNSHAVAVGTTTPNPGFAARPLVEQWNGTSWALTALPVAAGSLDAVSSDGTGDVAVGSTGSEPLVLTSPNGATWTSLSTAGLAASTKLVAVDAIAMDDIYAVGSTATTTTTVTTHHTSRGKHHTTTTEHHTTRDAVIAKWNGSHWTETTVVHAPTGGSAVLTAISGASTTDLVVLGRATSPSGSSLPPLVLESNDGSWIDDAPQTLSAATLSSVASSPSGAWIIGSNLHGTSSTPLILASGTPDGSPLEEIATILLWLMAGGIVVALVAILLMLVIHRLHPSLPDTEPPAT